MLLDSSTARDLLRDARVLVHNVVTSREGTVDGEFMLRGRAVPEDDPRVNDEIAAAIAEELPWQPEVGKFDLFRIDIEHVASIRWGDHNDQYLTRWPPGHEQVRRRNLCHERRRSRALVRAPRLGRAQLLAPVRVEVAQPAHALARPAGA